MNKAILGWELAGTVWILLLGSILHSALAKFDYWLPLTFVAPVNESIWEHFKIVLWPAVLFGWLQSRFIQPKQWLAIKSCSILIMPLTISLMFYGYTWFTLENYLIVDISLFVVSVILSQSINYCLFTGLIKWHGFMKLAPYGLIILLILTLIFSHYPPHIGIFEHSNSGHYGPWYGN
ncbi:DUF6512 family protein [Paraferrimonas sp. SM1919]|uniref:DUF6512 family protein n=1 Tax=Paraferrimonas sp. SM1919 TaxID=2662263 RepID=UPI0013D05548|nr:DUF6512 family protein [Paraferrimonas sp. SM1919]